MKIELSEKTALVFDYGSYISVASRLARERRRLK
jgi:hypothetical protein